MDFQKYEMFPDSDLAKKYGAEKTKTTKIIKNKENHFSVLKKPNAQCLFEKIIFRWLFAILFLFLRLYFPVTRK